MPIYGPKFPLLQGKKTAEPTAYQMIDLLVLWIEKATCFFSSFSPATWVFLSFETQFFMNGMTGKKTVSKSKNSRV